MAHQPRCRRRSRYGCQMSAQTRSPVLAFIREAECIGCTKCIQACPVDAILGSAKQMHTIIADECIGCKLCLPPCPVDCIDLLPVKTVSSADRKQRAAHIKRRYTDRQKRLQNNEGATALNAESTDRKTFIQNTLARIKSKRMTLE